MDGLTIATSIVQLIDIATKVVSRGVQIHKAADGRLDEYREIEVAARDLSRGARDINRWLARRHGNGKTSPADEQEEVAVGCQAVAGELAEVLGRLTSAKKKTPWQSARQAIGSIWREDKIRSLERRLDRFRQQMTGVLLGSLR